MSKVFQRSSPINYKEWFWLEFLFNTLSFWPDSWSMKSEVASESIIFLFLTSMLIIEVTTIETWELKLSWTGPSENSIFFCCWRLERNWKCYRNMVGVICDMYHFKKLRIDCWETKQLLTLLAIVYFRLVGAHSISILLQWYKELQLWLVTPASIEIKLGFF